jgi:hypothetical protein
MKVKVKVKKGRREERAEEIGEERKLRKLGSGLSIFIAVEK